MLTQTMIRFVKLRAARLAMRAIWCAWVKLRSDY